MTHRSHRKPLALGIALLTLFALVVPLAGSALAAHTSYVNAEPESDVNPPRSEHTIKAYTSTPGVEVNFNIECDDDEGTAEPTEPTDLPAENCTSPNTDSSEPLPIDRPNSDFECVTGSQTDPTDPATPDGYSCSITYTDSGSDSTNDTDFIRVWSDEGDNDDTFQAGEPSDTVTKTWENNPVLDCEPETADNPSTGPDSDHTITCTVTTSAANGGDPLEGATVHFENETSGVNDPDNNADRTNPDNGCSAPTGENGECSGTYTSEGQTGTATIRAWVDTGAAGGDDADASETQAIEDEDNTDVVTKTWSPPGDVDALPTFEENPVGTEHTITAYTTQPSVEVNFNIESGPNSNDDDPPEPVGNPTTSDFECTTSSTPDQNDPGEPNRHSCSWTYLGSGGAGTDNIRVWVDTGSGSAGNDDEWQTGEPNDFVQKLWYEQDAEQAALDCGPETATNPTIGPDSTHEVTCTVTDEEGAPFLGATVHFENESPTVNDPDDNSDRTDPDRTCTTSAEPDGDGQCSVEYPSENQAGTATIRAWVDADGDDETDDSDASETQAQTDSDGTDVVTKTWEAVDIDASPNQDSNPIGAEHTITAATGDPGVEVNFNIEEGPHSNDDATNPLDRTTSDFECVTDTNPQGGYTCSWTYEGTEEGTDSVRVWFDEGTNDDEFQEGEPNDVVTKTWYTQDIAQARLDCEPETGSNPAVGEGSDHTITCTVRDQQNNPFFAARVHLENESPTVNDPDNNADRTNPDKTCTTPEAPDGNGECQATYTSEGETGTATIRAWVDSDNDAATDNSDANELPGENDQDGTDVVTKRWVDDARTIECAPETATNPVGTDHVVTCTVLDRNGEPVPGEDVTFSSSGPGSVSPTGDTTDSSGRARTTARSTQSGTQSITGTITDDLTGGEPSDVDECDRAANDPAGAPAGQCADTVTKTWEGGEEPPVVDSGPCQGREEGSRTPKPGGGEIIVGTPEDDALVGTEGDDTICGLGGNDVIDALGGNDQVVGNQGDDTIDGGAGRDQLNGGVGNDSISGRGGNDTITGKGGNDVLKGNQGRDTIKGGGGKDTIQGGSGVDTMSGGAGADTIRGWTKDDVLRGNGGNDLLIGNAGNDFLHGGGGRDTCRGGKGRDTFRKCERKRQ